MPELRVLLVEDSDDDAILVGLQLKRHGGGAHIRRVTNLAALESSLDEGPWDVVVSDFNLEDFDGLAALEVVRRHPSRVPFILVSAAVGEETAVAAMRAGASDYVMKSSLGRLLPAIEREVREAADRRERETRIAHLTRVRAVLSAANAAMLRVRERDDLYREACRIAIEQGGFALAWVGEFQEGGLGSAAMKFSTASSPVAREGATACVAPLCQDVARQGSARVWNDLAADAPGAFEALLAAGVRCLVILPLAPADASSGAIAFGATEPHAIDDEELRLLRELAGDIAFTLGHIGQRERLEHLAFFDAVTGLANRRLFADRLGQALEAAASVGRSVAACVVDIDRFSAVNATLGRHVGDALLREAGARLTAAFEAAHVARVGADEFALVVPQPGGVDDAARHVRDGIARAFATPFTFEGHEIPLSVRSGIATYPEDAADAPRLLERAEAAVARAKAMGEASLFYNAEMTTRVAARLALEGQLRGALERGEFEPHYQPKVDAAGRRLVGAEALMRWRNPSLGLVPPVRFIPMLEETGLILEVGDWMLRRVAEDVRAWRALGLAAPRTAVNVSVRQLERPDFVARVAAILDGGEAEIDIEIVESLAMADPQASIAKLAELNRLGVRVYIDDFGTGYSSLAYLARLPVQGLKIDRSFTSSMLADQQSHAMVSTIVALSRSLGLEVVAEGVETEDQAAALLGLGCDHLQGYLTGRPIAGDAFRASLGPTRGDGRGNPGIP